MSNGLIMAAQMISALAILVTLHEWGHFAAARMFGIKVEKFYLFFDAWGFKLFKFKKGDTEYGIGWLPLGGYVKIAGMIDESLDTEQLSKAPEPWEFRSKPAWQRMIVMLGGIIVNVILGVFIFILHTWYYGETKVPVDKLSYGIAVEQLGEDLGLKNGDHIYAVNDKKITYFDEINQPILFLKSGNFYNIKRGDQDLKINIPDDMIDKLSDKRAKFIDIAMPCVIDSIMPKDSADKAGFKKGDKLFSLNDTTFEFFHQFSKRKLNYSNKKIKVGTIRGNDTLYLTIKLNKEATMGFSNDIFYKKDTVQLHYGFAQSLSKGTNRSYETLRDNILGFKKLISGKINPTKSMQGPIGIASMFGSDWVWERFWTLTAMLSLILAFMNLLPIPALDGGHVMFLIAEMIMRKPLNEKFMHIMQVIGMVILLSLMVFICGNDVYRLIQRL